MSFRDKILILSILALVPTSLFFLRWVFFVLGKTTLNLLMRNLDERSKLRHQIIEIYRRNEEVVDLVFILVGLLLTWFLFVIANMFI